MSHIRLSHPLILAPSSESQSSTDPPPRSFPLYAAVFCGDIEERRLREKLSLHTRAVAQIRHRTAKILHTMKQEEAMGTAGSEWIYGIKYFGITTHYQLADDGCITVRMEGGLVRAVDKCAMCPVLYVLHMLLY